MDEFSARRVLAQLVALRAPALDSLREAVDWTSVVRAGRFHGVLPWIHAHWSTAALTAETSEVFALACAAEARRVAAMDLAQRAVCIELLPALAAVGVRPVLLKGAVLAHTHYGASAWRPRSDIDLLVPSDAWAACTKAFSGLGYRRAQQLPGRYVSSQETWSSRGEGSGLSIDLHWRINNSPVLATLLDHDELAAAGVDVPMLGPFAQGPSAAHALLHAALHLVGSRDTPFHHVGWSKPGGDRLIWLLDFVLLIRAADAAQREQMHALIAAKGAQALIAAAATALQRDLGEAAEPEFLTLSAMASSGARGRWLSRYVVESRLGRQLMDFRSLGSWRARWGFLHEQLLPPLDYLQARDPTHADSSRTMLALRRLLQRPRGTS